MDPELPVLLRAMPPTRPADVDAPTAGGGEAPATVPTPAGVADVTLLEQQARDLAERLRLALDAGGLGTWHWDMATGVTEWDERLERLFGMAPGEFNGTYESWLEAVHPDDRDHAVQTLEHAIETKSPYVIEHRVVWPDGSVHWIEGAGTVTLDASGNVTGTIGCSADVTARVELDVERDHLAAMAVEAAENERRNSDRLRFLVEINDALARSHTRHEIMVNIAAVSVPRLGDWCALHVLREDDGPPDVEVAHVDPEMVRYARELQERFPYDPSAVAGVPKVIRTGEAEFMPDITPQVIADLDASPEERQIVEQLALRSAITMPLKKRGRVLGAVQFVLSDPVRRYTADDVALAEAVAGRVASSLENTRLAEHQRHIAKTLQESLLPRRLPAIDGVDTAVRYWATGEGTEVGGDFYDVFSIGDQRWGAVVGDVCGKGPEAAALTGLARHSIRMSAWHDDAPARVLEGLNRAVLEGADDTFCTVAYTTIDTSGSGVTLASVVGGHPLPVLVRADGTLTTLGGHGTLLGAFERISCSPVTTPLSAGDTVVLYTDGVTDVAPPHDLSLADLHGIIGRAVAGATTAAEVADGIQVELERHLPMSRRTDDIALLVLRVTQD